MDTKEKQLVQVVLKKLREDGHIPLYGFLAGSNLFGTATPDSDRDYVVVYAPNLLWLVEMRPIESGKYRLSTNTGHGKNTKGDVDVQAAPVHTILKNFVRGDTNAIDWVFAPTKEDGFFYYHPSFKRGLLPFVESGQLCIHRLDGAVGYAVHQAAKYGIKGSRLGDAITLHERLGGVDPDTTVKEVTHLAGGLKNVKVIQVEVGNAYENGLEVMGRTLHPRMAVGRAVEWLEGWIEKYGNRARQAMKNDGVDWKAVSHAFRACEEARQYATTGMVKFPLENAEFLKRVKAGEIPFREVARLLEKELEEINGLSLPPCEDTMPAVLIYRLIGYMI